MQRHNRFLSWRKKLMLFYALATLLPFLASSFIAYYIYTDSSEEHAKQYTRQIMHQAHMNLENYFKEVRKLTIYPFYDEAVMELLKRHNQPYDPNRTRSFLEYSRMNIFLSSLAFDRPEIRGVVLAAHNGSLFSSMSGVEATWTPEGSSWMKTVREADGRAILLDSHVPEYYPERQDPIYSIARLVKEPFTNVELGYIKADFTSSVFHDILSSVSNSNLGKLYVANLDGNIIYPKTESGLSVALPQEGRVEIDGIGYIRQEQDSPLMKMKLIALIPEKELVKDAQQAVRLTLLTFGGSLILSVLVSIAMSSRLTGPLLHLQRKMKSVQTGNFKERAVLVPNDEVGQLALGFNRMVGEIERLVLEVYETKMREREAELSALQSQINPHFLYNTLDMVNMIALEQRQYEICDIMSSLGKLLRYTVDKQERPVRLLEEIRFVEAYFRIQSIRCGEDLHVSIHVPMELESALVPKLVLQPLVENAIIHGLAEGKGTVAVEATREGDDLVLVVTDDGLGLTEAELAAIRERIARHRTSVLQEDSFGADRRGYALPNVHQRVVLLYGPEYGLTVQRASTGGAKFVIRLRYSEGSEYQ